MRPDTLVVECHLTPTDSEVNICFFLSVIFRKSFELAYVKVTRSGLLSTAYVLHPELVNTKLSFEIDSPLESVHVTHFVSENLIFWRSPLFNPGGSIL